MFPSPLRRSKLEGRFFDLHPEQLIALARLALAAFAYLAIYLDPSQPARNSEVTYGLLFVYLFYSGGAVALTSMLRIGEGAQIVFHAIDIVTFSMLMHFTDGPTSPFFVFFTFALLAAMLRWDWPGVVITAFVLVTTLIFVSYADVSLSLREQDDDLNRLIVRATYLLVLGVILGYVSAIRERDRERLTKLAAWPQEEIRASVHPPISGSLRHAASVIGAKRVLVAWDDGVEPHLQLAHFTGADCSFSTWNSSEPLVELSLERETFRGSDGTTRSVSVRSGRRQLPLPALDVGFSSTFNVGRFSCAAFAGQHVHGWVLILDPPPLAEGLLPLTDIVATRIGAELEHFYLRAELTRAAVARERERLARDMHDGLLQDLTAANLQLRNLARVVPEPASERIKDVAQLVSMQQQHIRDFVAAVNPKATSSELQTLAPQLRAFAARVSEQWRCRIGTTVEPADLRVPGQLVTELWLMLSEAAANAVRHGRATELTMDVHSGAGALHVAFRDDGQGTMHGDGFADLVPFSMSQRVSDLGGRLGRARVSRGFGLDIQLPLAS